MSAHLTNQRLTNRRLANLSRWLAVAVIVVAAGAGCGGSAGDDPGADMSCEELDARSDVDMVLCDDGETRIDRREEHPPARPQGDASSEP